MPDARYRMPGRAHLLCAELLGGGGGGCLGLSLLELLLLHQCGQLLLRQHDGDGGGLLAILGLVTFI